MSAEFREFAQSRGYELPPHIEPGRRFRFSTNGKHGDDAGWGVLFPDCLGGVVGDWRTGVQEVWQARRDHAFTQEERRQWMEKIERERRAAKAQKEKDDAEAASRAADIWRSSAQAPANHPYLTAKGVEPHGLRIYGGDKLVIGGADCTGALILPLRNADGQIRTLEFIRADGEKRFLPQGSYVGCYHAIGKPGDAVAICEGFSTGASIHKATSLPVRIAATAGNLVEVAKAIRAKAPKAKLILCADKDDNGTGQKYAQEAARACGGYVALPDVFEGTDFNDMMFERGLEAVKASIDRSEKTSEKKNGNSIIYARVSDIEAQPIRWLWPGRIARGKVSMIAGHPGLGKSQITTSLAAVVTQGGRWPVDRTPCERGSVLLLSAEDEVADTIRPRLEAAGADVGRVHIVQAIRDGFNSAGDEIQRPFNLKEDIRRLEAVLTEIGDVALIVIDPVSAYLGGTDSHNNADVRSLLAPLSEMAARAGAAVVAVSHLNKGGAGNGGDALLRVTGSLAFVAAARAAFIVAKDPENEKRRLFLPAKNNVAADSGGLAFAIEGCSIGGGIETSRIIWEAEPVTGVSADELMRVPTDPEDRSEIEEASHWLRDALSAGSVEARELFKLGEAQGFHKRAVQRARQRIGADTRRDGFGKGSKVVWFMPAKPSIDDNNPIDDTVKRQSSMGESVTYGAGLPPKAAKPPKDCQVSMAGSVGSLGSVDTPAEADSEAVE